MTRQGLVRSSMTSRLRSLVRAVVGAGNDEGAVADPSTRRPHEGESRIPGVIQVGDPAGGSYQTGHALMSGILREELAGKPRVNMDLKIWPPVELLDRARGLGASDAQLNQCVIDGDPHGDLMALVNQLTPPPSSSVVIDDLTVERTASVVECIAKLDSYGACVIKQCADPGLIDAVDNALTPFGAWSKNPEDRVVGSRTGRMGMNGLVHAPVCEHLLTNPKVLGVMNGLLG